MYIKLRKDVVESEVCVYCLTYIHTCRIVRSGIRVLCMHEQKCRQKRGRLSGRTIRRIHSLIQTGNFDVYHELILMLSNHGNQTHNLRENIYIYIFIYMTNCVMLHIMLLDVILYKRGVIV